MGVWHGAGWNFVLLGIMHGAAVATFSIWMRLKIKLPNALGCFLTFNFINLSLIPVRVKDIGETIRVMKSMFGLNGVPLSPLYSAQGAAETSMILSSLTAAVLIAVVQVTRNSTELAKAFRPNMWYLLLTIVLFLIPVFNITRNVKQFIYFRF
jgi:D-alanyl-lipoteichoic acid acyltransferase DltB (MBOAT superfamily)